MTDAPPPAPSPAPPGFWARHGVLVATLGAVVLSASALRVGALSDDFLQHLVLEGTVPVEHLGPLTLYDFTGGRAITPWIERGYLPWQSHPELSLRFFRPLASASIALDHALFGRNQPLGHLVNLAWYLGLVAVAIAWFAEILPKNRAGLASVIFAVAGGHAMNVAWTSTRHLLISAVFAGMALWLHVRARNPTDDGTRPFGTWSALPLWVLALLSSEATLSALAILGSYELFGRTDALAARVKALAPAATLGLAYLVFYAVSGYGVAHSGLYVSPFSQPLDYALAAASRVPILGGELSAAIPSSLWGQAPDLRPTLVALGLVFMSLIALLLVRARLDAESRRAVRWLAIGTLFSLLPAVGGVLEGRLLALPSLAGAAVVATAIEATFARTERARLARVGAALLMGLHLVGAPLARFGMTHVLAQISDKQRGLAQNADLSACPSHGVGLIATGSDPSLSLSGATSLAYYRPELFEQLQAIYVLSMAPHRQRVERLGTNTLELEVLDPPRIVPLFERVFRDDPITAGYGIDTGKFGAKVMATEAGVPLRVRFKVPVDSCLLVWKDQRLTSVTLPDVGDSLMVDHEPGPFGL